MAQAEKLKVDPNNLTIGDMEDFEEIVGQTLDEALSPVTVVLPDGSVERDEKGRPVKAVRMPAKTLKALIFIVKRQEDPNFTLDDARNIKVSELDLGGDDEPETKASRDAEKNDESA